MAVRLDGPSTFEKGMILFTGADIILFLYPSIQRMGSVLGALPKDCDVIQGLFALIQLFDLGFFDEVAGHPDDVVILQIPGEIAETVSEGTFDDRQDRFRRFEVSFFKFEDISGPGREIFVEFFVDFQLLKDRRLRENRDPRPR